MSQVTVVMAGVLFTDVVLQHIDVHKNVDPDMIRSVVPGDSVGLCWGFDV